MESSPYNTLTLIPYEIIRKKNDKFYKIVDPTKIRRDYSWRHEKIIQQRTLFDFRNLVLLSNVHIKPSHPKVIKLEISSEENGPFICIEKEIEVIGGCLRIVKVGSLPCRFLRMTFLKGCPIMDFSTVQLYGMQMSDMPSKLNDDSIDLLFYSSYNFLYK